MRLDFRRFEIIAERWECDCCGTYFRILWRINPKPKPPYVPTAEQIALHRFQLTDEYLDIIAPIK